MTMTTRPLESWTLTEDRVLRGEVMAREGDTVYRYPGHDYGLSSDDTHGLGVEHISVTLDHTGLHPFFTCPLSILKPKDK